MANIHTLVASVNNLYLFSERNGKFHCCDTVDALARRQGNGKKKKCGHYDYLGGCGSRVSALGHSWRLWAATELHALQVSSRENTPGLNQVPFIEIPLTCYQIIGVNDQTVPDEIAKAVMNLKAAQIEEGYTKDAVISRQDLLTHVRDKLLFEPEYSGKLKNKQSPKSSLKIPWAWLPGALCLLQEVGEEKLVLDIARRALQHPESKRFVHDLLISMALAECTIAKFCLERNHISHGFDALARAQCLLRSKISLEKIKLLSEIEESLEKLAPACTLYILGMPQSPENAERRPGAVAALRELLGQGLNDKNSCQVEDWPCFLNQAFKKLMATEIVELMLWDSLALARKDRKSLRTKNQRDVIDFNSFYVVLLAHIALGFSSKQMELINKAKSICECLIASEDVDLKFEEAVCSSLLARGDESTAMERVRQLELNSGSGSLKSLQMKDTREVSNANNQLETWLKESVLALFPDTRECSPSLADFFIGEKRASGNRQNKRGPLALSGISHRPPAVALPLDRRDEESVSSTESSRHLGPAAKQLAPPDLQSPLIEGKTNAGSSIGSPSIQLKRTLGLKKGEAWKFSLGFGHMLEKLIYATALGCILTSLFKIINMQVWRPRSGPIWSMDGRRIEASSPAWTNSSTDLSYRDATIRQNGITRKLRKLLSLLKIQSGVCTDSADLQAASLSSGLPSSISPVYRQPMPVEDAEALVKRWQAIKAEALGPDHNIYGLTEILEGSMLVKWEALADAARARLCYWKFVLLQLTVINADILNDGVGRVIAEIEVLLEEAAELVDESQPKNPTYYSPYKIRYLLKRQDDGSWRFCEGDILATSP